MNANININFISFVLGLIVACVVIYFVIQYAYDTYMPYTLKTIIPILVRQAARWSTAAKQDENSMVSVLHANYGAGYLWAIKDIASDNQVEKIANINMRKFAMEILKTQDYATKKMAKLCSEYAPDGTYLTKIGGEG